jgi:outer membrane protein OmpA-like peptidoglycan-associated protein
MPRSSVIVRSLAVVSLGLVAVPAFGQSANVMAFNPYGGAGASSGSAPAPVYAVPPGASAGMAFNPWNPDGGAAAGGAYAGRGNAPSPYATGSSSYGGGSYGARLPDPPPGPIESRLTAVPERPARSAAPPPRTAAVAAPPPAPAVVEAPAAPAPAPMVITPRPPAPTPAPVVATPAPTPPPAAATPAPAPPPKVASVAPPPRPEPTPAAPAPASVMASVTFVPQSAEIGPAARAELDRVAQNTKSVRALELRAYASGSDPIEARKVALARALAVRSYLIDQNVKTRIEVGAFASTNGGGERVDVLAP